MPLEKVIPFVSRSGNQYLIGFSVFNTQDYNFGIPVININLELVSEFSTLSLIDLICITNIIEDYLNNNNVVLYYYCGLDHVNRSTRNTSKEPQEYRSNLFDRMYERVSKDKGLTKNDIIIRDNESKCHYISLISKDKNNEIMTTIANQISVLSDKSS